MLTLYEKELAIFSDSALSRTALSQYFSCILIPIYLCNKKYSMLIESTQNTHASIFYFKIVKDENKSHKLKFVRLDSAQLRLRAVPNFE